MFCYGKSEALGVGNQGGHSHEQPVTSSHPMSPCGGCCGDSAVGLRARLSPPLCHRFSALHHAALGGSLDLILLLLEAQATVDIKDSNGKG